MASSASPRSGLHGGRKRAPAPPGRVEIIRSPMRIANVTNDQSRVLAAGQFAEQGGGHVALAAVAHDEHDAFAGHLGP